MTVTSNIAIFKIFNIFQYLAHKRFETITTRIFLAHTIYVNAEIVTNYFIKQGSWRTFSSIHNFHFY